MIITLSCHFTISHRTPAATSAPPDIPPPDLAAEARRAVILVPNSIPSSIRFEDVMKLLNDSLKVAGQNVEFKQRAVSYDSSGTNSFLASGK